MKKRKCSECNSEMEQGFYNGNGLVEEYYCSDKCLHKNYTEKEWENLYEEGGEAYWTTWFE